MTVPGQERAILVGLDLKSRTRRGADRIPYGVEESLEELRQLAATAGARVEEVVIQSRPAPDVATLIGSGKLDELRALIQSCEADVVFFDSELTPTQLRNLERALECKILDRTQLILDIFARRARTREGQLQVELAQLNYLLPRLTGRGVEMSRLGGGIGTRGPGETQLETDRRRIYARIKKLGDQLEHVRSGRGTQRHQRQSVPLETIAMVGYTNAGKSTLFNRLTGAEVPADARMFATLDPTVRHIVLPSHRQVLVSDTVGFIRNLPTTLVKAFRATLEEVTEASLLLHVVDASSPYAPHQTAHVLKVVSEIGAEQTRQILVLNKMDLLPDSAEESDSLAQRILGEVRGPVGTQAICVSARTGAGFETLLTTMDAALSLDPVSRAKFRIPAGEGSLIHLLHERAKVLGSRYEDDICELDAEVPESVKRRLAHFAVE
ncbi:MAG TPA: GTPase HflX [Bryobacteraceae bacterium]|nr:GTPase HflX [Bryobacteraceae bacterium]